MSYQVIARKYRPQTFADLTGQEHITRTLGHALDGGRLHHAYLFSGVRGTGKTTTARILAKGLNCREGLTSKPCLQCASCLEVAGGNSLDVLEIDAASNTGVENIRDVIINNIAMAPARDRYKVFVIDEVHMLSGSAFNALLKTLEEPPAHVVFVMATTELHKVPDTILSRCQQFEFRQIPTEKIFLRLREIAGQEQITINAAALREIARAGAGSLRDAQSAFDQVIAFSGAEISEADVAAALGLVSAATLGRATEAIAAQDTSELLSLVEDVSSRGYDLRNFTRELMSYWRGLLVVKSGMTTGEVLGFADVEIDRLKQLAPRFSEEDLVRCFHLLAETEKEIKDSPQPRFQLEIGLVKLSHALRLKTLNELIERLTELEQKLPGAPGNAAGGPRTVSHTRSSNSPPEVPSFTPTFTPRGSLTTENTTAQVDHSVRSTEASAKPPEPELSEPPDFPDFDQFEPDDIPEFEVIAPASVKHTAPANSSTIPAVAPGREIEAIQKELQRLNRGLAVTALEDAQQLEYRDGALIAIFTGEDIFTRRLRESGRLFREIGERLFGAPLRVEVRIGGQGDQPPAEPGAELIDEAEQKRRQLHERALQNPAIRSILEQTRGEIVWVKEQ